MKNCYEEAYLATTIAAELHENLSKDELKCLCSFLRLLLNNVEYYIFRQK